MLAATLAFLEECGGSPGRASHGKSLDSSRAVYNTRDLLASLFYAPSAERIIFTKNATEAINMVLFGFLGSGDHVIASSMEHNAVMRPLRQLETQGLQLTLAPCDSAGRLDPSLIRQALTPRTKLIVLTHASNVTGTLMPVAEVGAIAKAAGVRFAVDAAQTAGVCALNMAKNCIDFLVFTGHKALGGPQGTGGLALGPDVELRPLTYGGTGSASESELQPSFLPDKLESGTLNAVGIAGLGAALEDLNHFGVSNVLVHERRMIRLLREGVRRISAVSVYGPDDPDECVGVLSLNIGDVSCTDAGMRLEREFGVLTRTGLHCAPAAHRTIGTFKRGAVRFSVSRFTTEQDIEAAVKAIASIAQGSV